MMGTSAYDLDRLSALPDFQEYEEQIQEAHPREMERPRPQPQKRTRAERQSVTGFAVLGWMVVCVLLLLVVLSHMQLAMVSNEMARLDRQRAVLATEAQELQALHELAFGEEAFRIATEELGMVEAARGQVVIIGGGAGDVAEVVYAAEVTDGGVISYLLGLLREYLPFLSE